MKTMTVKPWHSALMIIVLIAIFGLLTNYLLNNETVKPIVIEPNQLTKSQFGALQQAIEPIGKVQFFWGRFGKNPPNYQPADLGGIC